MSPHASHPWRQPAEWAPHDAVWLAWPHLQGEWGDHLGGARQATVELARAIAAGGGEQVELLVPPDADHAAIEDAFAGSGARLHPMPYGDVWLRDTAPVFVTDGEAIAATCFRFNGWAEKYLFDHDPRVARRIAERLGVLAHQYSLVCEGGGVESNGDGTLLTTRQCLLHPKRNPGVGEAEVAATLREAYGADHVVWLGEGLANDHTDGHVDTLARFVRPNVVVCMEPSGPTDPNREVLDAIARDLAAARDARGEPFEIVRVPSPGRVTGGDGALLAASYVNFYIGNRTVVVPTYGAPGDAEAVDVLAELFPERRVVGLDAYAVVTGGGAFHCISREQPTP